MEADECLLYSILRVRIVDAWVVVIVCAWEGESLVAGTRLGVTDADLRAG